MPKCSQHKRGSLDKARKASDAAKKRKVDRKVEETRNSALEAQVEASRMREADLEAHVEASRIREADLEAQV